MFTNNDSGESSGTRFFYWFTIVATVGLFGVAAFSPAPKAATVAPVAAKVVQTTAPSPTIETVTVVAKRLAS